MENYLHLEYNDKTISFTGFDNDKEMGIGIDEIGAESQGAWLTLEQVQQLHAFLGEQLGKVK